MEADWLISIDEMEFCSGPCGGKIRYCKYTPEQKAFHWKYSKTVFFKEAPSSILNRIANSSFAELVDFKRDE